MSPIELRMMRRSDRLAAPLMRVKRKRAAERLYTSQRDALALHVLSEMLSPNHFAKLPFTPDRFAKPQSAKHHSTKPRFTERAPME